MPFVQTQSGRHIETDLSLDELDLTAAGSKAACTEDESHIISAKGLNWIASPCCRLGSHRLPRPPVPRRAGHSGASTFCIPLASQQTQKLLGSLGENLILFPHDTKPGLQGGGERAEAKFAVPGGIDDFVQCDGITNPFFHKQGRVEEQVIGHDNIQFADISLQPCRHIATDGGLMR